MDRLRKYVTVLLACGWLLIVGAIFWKAHQLDLMHAKQLEEARAGVPTVGNIEWTGRKPWLMTQEVDYDGCHSRDFWKAREWECFEKNGQTVNQDVNNCLKSILNEMAKYCPELR